MHKQESIQEKEMHKFLQDFEIVTDQPTTRSLYKVLIIW